MDQKLFDFLSNYVTEHKKNLFQEVLSQRTRHLTVVIEDVYHPHNASAILRTAECFGLQDLYVIENRFEYKPSRNIIKGSGKWVDIITYPPAENNVSQCLRDLKSKGYKVIAATPHSGDANIEDLDINSPTAIVFGGEKVGVSEEAIAEADGFVKIPIYGFTESFNVSVAAGIILHHLTLKIRQSLVNWQLPEKEKQEKYAEWVLKTVRHKEALMKHFYQSLEQQGEIS
jgi:tRNA (guanosine-2'-O-)-methyltransferase